MPRALLRLAIVLFTTGVGAQHGEADGSPVSSPPLDAVFLPTIQSSVWSPGLTTPRVAIGAVITLTCCTSRYNESWMMLRSYEMMLEGVNVYGGGVMIGGVRHLVDFIAYDDRGDADTAVQAAQALLDQGVKLFLGPIGDNSNEAVAHLLAQHDAVMVTAGSAEPQIFAGHPNIFGVLPMDYFSATVALLMTQQPQPQTIVVMKDSTPSSQQACGGIEDVVLSNSLTLVTTFTIPSNPDSQLLSYALRQIGQTPDILITCFVYSCMEMFLALEEVNMNPLALAMAGCINSTGYITDLPAQFNKLLLTRFALTVTDWMGNYNGSTDESGFTSQGFQVEFRNRNGKDATRTAANAWTAVQVLVKAIAIARSAEPADVVAALNVMTVETIVGNISFDSQGMAIRQVFTSQLGVEGPPRLILPSSQAPVVYPFPPWAARSCLQPRLSPVDNASSATGFVGDVCSQCGSTLWAPDVWAREPGWRCVDRLCNPGEKQSASGTCDACPAGWYSNENTSVECTMCTPGTFTRLPGMSSCELCDFGEIAADWASTTCVACAAGWHNPVVGSSTCWPCRAGFYSETPGSHHCTHCEHGHAANTSAMSRCDACEPGKHSKRGVAHCSDCELGRFQSRVAQMECLKCPDGADCETTGLRLPPNKRNWYAIVDDAGDWDLQTCVEEDVCLEDARCAKGQTGILCRVCFPRRVRVGDDGCSPCPSSTTNIFLFLLALLISCVFVVSLTALAISTAGRSKAMASALAKLFLNYVTTMSVVFLEIERKITDIHRDRAGDQLGSFSEQFLEFTLGACDLGVGFLVDMMNPLCLLEPSLSDGDAEAVEIMAQQRHYEQFTEEFQSARAILTKMHWKTMLNKTVMWCSVPWIIFWCVTIFVAVLFRIHTRKKAAEYREAIGFFKAVEMTGWSGAASRFQLPARQFQNYMSLYEYRLLGIWRVMPLVNIQDQGMSAFVFHFLKDAEPLLVVICFFTYPYVVKGILGPLNCEHPLNDGVLRSRELPDVICSQSDDLLYWLSVALFVGMGLGVPLVGYCILKRATGRLLEPRFQRKWGFITGGYEIDRVWWETLVLLRKSTCTLISFVYMSSGLRVLSLLAASIIFHMLHIWYKPFDNKYGELLDRIESRHLHAWVLYSCVLLGLYMVDTGANNAVMVLFCVCILIVHMRFTAMIVFHLLVHLRNQLGDQIVNSIHQDQHLEYIKAFEDRLGGPTKLPPAKYTIKEAMKQESGYFNIAVLETYHRYLQRLPYVAVDHQRMWATLIGNTGGNCEPADCGDPTDKTFLLSQVKTPADVIHCAERDRKYFVDIVSEAFEFALVNQEVPVFSVNLLDFVLRCGFAFDVEGKRRSFLVNKAERKPTQVNMLNMARTSLNLQKDAEYQKKVQNLGERYSIQAHQRQATRLLMEHARGSWSFLGKVISNTLSIESPSKLQINDEIRQGIIADTEHMFQGSSYLRGLTLQEFQLNIAAKLMASPKEMLVEWLDQFEHLAEQKYMDKSQTTMFFRPETLLQSRILGSKWRQSNRTGAADEDEDFGDMNFEGEVDVGVQVALDEAMALESCEDVIIKDLHTKSSPEEDELVLEDDIAEDPPADEESAEKIAHWTKVVIQIFARHQDVWVRQPRRLVLRKFRDELQKLERERQSIQGSVEIPEGFESQGDLPSVQSGQNTPLRQSATPRQKEEHNFVVSLLGGPGLEGVGPEVYNDEVRVPMDDV